MGTRALWVSVGSWLLSGIASLQNLIDLPYFIRFPVTCLFALVGMVTLMLSLHRPSKKKTKTNKARLLMALYVFVYLLLATLSVLLLRLSLVYHSMTIEELSCAGGQCIEITPPRTGEIQTEIVLPSEVPARCRPYDPVPEEANLSLVDWNTLSPLLRIVGFRYPQRVGLRCSPAIDVKLLRPGPGVEFLSASRLTVYDRVRFGFGGALWLSGICVTIARWKRP